MKLQDIVEITAADIICGDISDSREVTYGFTSDLMSDVLTLLDNDILMITGLANSQAVRTASLSDIHMILFIRGKKPTDQMINMAREHDIILLSTPYSAFRTSALLYNNGLQAVY